MNIILLISDTFRYDNLFDRAAMPVSTPNLDAFADRAVSLERMYTGSFPTIPHRTDVTTGRIVFKHVLPNAIFPVIVAAPELRHPRAHLLDPRSDGVLLRRREPAEFPQHHVGATGEDLFVVHGIGESGAQNLRVRATGLEASAEVREELVLLGRRDRGSVLDGVGNAAQQVCHEHGMLEVRRQQANADRKGARDLGEHRVTERAVGRRGGRNERARHGAESA